MIFTLKTNQHHRARIVGCSNLAHETMGQTSTTDLDSQLLRWLISWHAMNAKGAHDADTLVASVDISTAFLNSAIPPDRVVLVRPPKILVDLGLVSQDTLWLVGCALYGLRESPALVCTWERATF